MRRTARLFPLLAALLLACGSSGPGPAPEPAPDFLLLDVNDTSPSYDTDVSPRDYVGFVTGFYFGAAT